MRQWLRRRIWWILGLCVALLLYAGYRYRVWQWLTTPETGMVPGSPLATSQDQPAPQPASKPAKRISTEEYDQAVHECYALKEAGKPIPKRLQKFVDDAYKSGAIVGTDPAKATDKLPNAEYDLMPRWQVGLVAQRCNWYTDRAAKNLQGQLDTLSEAERKRNRARWLWPIIIGILLGLAILTYVYRDRWSRNLTLPVPGAPQGVPPGGAIDPQAR